MLLRGFSLLQLHWPCNTPLPLVVPFANGGLNLWRVNLCPDNGHKYITMVIDYFTKLVEAIPTFNNMSYRVTHFFSIVSSLTLLSLINLDLTMVHTSRMKYSKH
jgi:hypothetical protein